ncbi:hypothetical protein [Taibaiella koreensis]|uniref:hypothetical protein n=1 Tax=Taibaiella koreensis TaxID=1268548 RepID=UPI000E59C688|nr:hypothetical protein [Taibaiella koreensis]
MITLCSIAALKAYTGPDEIVRVMGYHCLNDGGGGTFVWRRRTSLPTGAITDEGIFFSSSGKTSNNSLNQGLWERLDQDQVSAKWYGARGDGIADDNSAIQSALNCGALRIYLPYTPDGYCISGLTLPAGVSLIGTDSRRLRTGLARYPVLKIIPGQGNYGIRSLPDATGGSLEQLVIAGTTGLAFGLAATAADFRTVDVSIYGFRDAPGLLIDRGRRSVHTRLHIYDCCCGLQFTGRPEMGSDTVFNSLRHMLRAPPSSPPSSHEIKKGLWRSSASATGLKRTSRRRYKDDKVLFDQI